MSVAETYLRIVTVAVLITTPAGVGISLIGYLLVSLALGPNWLAATPVLEILAPAGSIAVFGFISAALFNAYGQLGSLFRIQVVCGGSRLILLIPLVIWLGIAGAAIALAAGMTIEALMYLVITFRRFGLRVSDLLRHVSRCLFATAAMAATLYMTGLGWHHVSGDSAMLLRRLFVAVSAGATIYVVVLTLTWLAAGRPAGGEADLLELMNRSGLAALRRRKPAVSV